MSFEFKVGYPVRIKKDVNSLTSFTAMSRRGVAGVISKIIEYPEYVSLGGAFVCISTKDKREFTVWLNEIELTGVNDV